MAPVTEIKRHATKFIEELREHRQPVIITEHGKEAAILLDSDSYREMKHRLLLLEGIARGERAFHERRVISHSSAKKRLQKWLKD